MKLKKIYVQEYKNLREFECEFSDSNITAFIGINGSGKSNLMEVITRTFSAAKNYFDGGDLTLIPPHEKPSILNCVIEYEVDGVDYVILYNTDFDKENAEGSKEKIVIKKNDKALSKKEMQNALPTSILLYYAGETMRQKGTAETTYDSVYERKLKRAESSELPGLRFMDYYSIEDLALLLAIASAFQGKYYSKILGFLKCSSIYPKFSVILKKPDKGSGTPDTYWGATGFVKFFLDELRRYVVSTKDIGKQYFMFFDSTEVLRKVAQNEFDLFAKLKALKHYGYLYHIGIELEKEDGTKVSSLRLSEGEKQLTLLMLLTSFTAQNECLYLFDEFDAYLHLNWQRQFASNIVNTGVKGHILFTTHSPASISTIKMDNLFIMSDGSISLPESETYNRALNEIMFEQMDVTMHSPEIEELYDQFKQCIADRNKVAAESIREKLTEILDPSDPLLLKLKITLRRI